MIMNVDYTEAALTIFLYERLNSDKWHNGGITYLRTTIPGQGSADDRDPAMQMTQIAFWNSVIEA